MAPVLFLLAMLGGCSSNDPSAAPVLRSADEYQATLARARELSHAHLEEFESGGLLDEPARADLLEAERLFNGLIGFDPTKFAPYIGVGKIAYALGDYKEAKSSLRQGLKLIPPGGGPEITITMSAAHDDLAHIMLLENDYANAENEVSQALALIQDEPNYLATLASIRIQQGKPAEARKLVARGLELDPDNRRCLGLERLLKAAEGK